jgi:hypothetical protein
MGKQVQRLRSTTKQVDRPEQHEQRERDSRWDEVSEQADCCIADIDALIEETCCLLDEAAGMLSASSDVVESAPTEEEFTAARQALKDAYWRTRSGSAEERDALAALKAYEDKWPQHAHLCTC